MPAYVCKSEKARLCNCYCIRNSFLKLCDEYLTVYLHQSLSINLRLGCPLGLTAYATSQFRSTESIRNTPTPDLQLISSVTVRVALSTLDQLRWKQLKYFVKHKKKKQFCQICLFQNRQRTEVINWVSLADIIVISARTGSHPYAPLSPFPLTRFAAWVMTR